MKIVITAPHAGGPTDTASAAAATRLDHALSSRGVPTVLRVATVRRTEIDLNRAEARDHEWRRQLRLLVLPGDILIDVHSFPSHTPTGHFDLYVINDFPRNTAQDSTARRLCRTATDRGLQCGVLVGCGNDIQDEAVELGALSVLVEFNQDRTRGGAPVWTRAVDAAAEDLFLVWRDIFRLRDAVARADQSDPKFHELVRHAQELGFLPQRNNHGCSRV